MKKVFFGIIFFGLVNTAFAQEDPMPVTRGNTTITNRNIVQKKDSTGFQQRDDLKDSITISYRYLDAIKRYSLDSAVNDFDKYFSVPSSYQYLGNNGAAAFPLIYQPFNKVGWDAGFHAFDIYKFTIEDTKFYKTTRPFSLLGYQLAAGKEQMIQAQHTQNIKPNFNAGFDYRLINAPGLFINQNNNHNNVRFFSSYQGKKKRYNAYFVLVSNTIRASENGGIVNDSFLLNPNTKDRFGIDVNMGNASQFFQNPFSTNIRTGNIYKNSSIFLQQSYDLGKKDSIAVNDSTTEYLFYPRLRVQHSITYSSYKYNFKDVAPDSVLYDDWYDIKILQKPDTISYAEKWKVIENDFSLIQFPDPKNPAQFFKAGATIQNLKATIKNGDASFYNIKLHGEYRNRTRNKLWDMQLKGAFYLNGLNGGDYTVAASLSRFLNKKLGDIRLYFSNTSRTPSFIFDERSSFNLGNINNFNKENITSFGATAINPFVQLGFANHLISNYSYFYNYYQTKQSSKLINILQASASKKIKLTKRWNWYLDATLQQTDAAAAIKVPLLYTRSRIAYEGNFFKNLSLSTGIEVRYYTPYKANNYSPLVGQFTPQDTLTLKNLPDVSAFLHFRIKSFTGFLRSENLNTMSFKNGFGFVDNNFSAPHIPTQGMIIRFGIRWWFVN
ncbi:MAG: putative porin [Ferruginibacter sp.]